MKKLWLHVEWWLPSLVFLFLFGFAGWAWFERMNSDAGYYLFHALNKKIFYIEHQRYVLAVAELPALVAMYCGAPLKMVVMAYSVGHVLFFALATLLAFKLSGQQVFLLLIPLLALVGLRESVYTPQFELYYGLVFLVLGYACYVSSISKYFQYFGLFVCLFMSVTAHPFCAMCAVYLFVFVQLYKRKFNVSDTLFFVVFLVLYFVWKKYVASGYEAGKIQLYSDAIMGGKWKEILSIKVLLNQFVVLVKYYPDILLFFVTGIAYLLYSKRYILLLYYIVSIILFLLLVWTMYPNTTEVFRYLEQVYFPLVFLVLLVLITLPNINVKPLKWLLVFCVAYRIFVIVEAYPVFAQRTAFMDQFIAQSSTQNGQRFYVTKTQMGEVQYNLGDWSYGFETLVRSAATSNKSITIVKDEDLFFNNNDSLLQPDEYLFRMWEIEKTSSLNPKYFQIDSGKYSALKD